MIDMTRSNTRELALHLLYAVQCGEQSVEEVLSSRMDAEYYASLSLENELYTEKPSKKQLLYIQKVVSGVTEKRQELDEKISRLSENWKINRISTLARAILELAMYEALYVSDVPVNVAIHEAVLLAKKYEEAETVKFVNGILGAFSKELANAPEEGAPC